MIRNLLSVIAIVATASAAHAAFEFGPIIATLTPSGSSATVSFTVSNTGENKIPVQITIVPREPDENGKEVYKETDAVGEMFRIFPAQLVLNSKETRTVRVSYVGDPKIKSELAFRVIAEELPVDVSDPKKVYKKAVANVSIAIKYVGSLYVTPSGAKAELTYTADPADKNLVLMVTNKGTTHQVIRKPVLKLVSMVDNSELTLEPAELPTLTNLNILSGKARKFVLEWPKKLPVGPVKASFDLSKE